MNLGLLTRLVEFLKFDDMEKLQIEAACILTNITPISTENVVAVINADAIPILTILLSSPCDRVKEGAIWALGNIAGDSKEHCEQLLSQPVLQKLLPLVHSNINTQKQDEKANELISGFIRQSHPNFIAKALMDLVELFYSTMEQRKLLRIATWMLRNIARWMSLNQKHAKLVLEELSVMIKVDDEQILEYVCWTYTYLTESGFQVGSVCKSPGLFRLVNLLQHDSSKIRYPALRTIGNIATGNDKQTQDIVNLNVLKGLAILLQDSTMIIRRDACWVVSNITAGNQEQIKAVIQANLVPALIDIIKNDEYGISKEALWAICNMVLGYDDEQVMYVADQGVIGALCRFLDIEFNTENSIRLLALRGVEYILRVGIRESMDGINIFKKLFEECGIIDYLEVMQRGRCTSDNVHEKAAHIANIYFHDDEPENRTDEMML